MYGPTVLNPVLSKHVISIYKIASLSPRAGQKPGYRIEERTRRVAEGVRLLRRNPSGAMEVIEASRGVSGGRQWHPDVRGGAACGFAPHGQDEPHVATWGWDGR